MRTWNEYSALLNDTKIQTDLNKRLAERSRPPPSKPHRQVTDFRADPPFATVFGSANGHTDFGVVGGMDRQWRESKVRLPPADAVAPLRMPPCCHSPTSAEAARPGDAAPSLFAHPANGSVPPRFCSRSTLAGAGLHGRRAEDGSDTQVGPSALCVHSADGAEQHPARRGHLGRGRRAHHPLHGPAAGQRVAQHQRRGDPNGVQRPPTRRHTQLRPNGGLWEPCRASGVRGGGRGVRIVGGSRATRRAQPMRGVHFRSYSHGRRGVRADGRKGCRHTNARRGSR